MRFVDQATIVAIAGDGGHGSRHFRREKNVPLGGPDGGDGGRGGDVVVRATQRARSLLDFHFNRIHRAHPGKPGAESRKTGRSADALVLDVPPGTVIYDADTDEVLADLVAEGDEAVVAEGGNGGWGNVHFKSATRQAPDRANSGLDGERRSLRLELKLLADVALVGLPNAGKSSLIRKISASKAEVGDYPFTTLVPNLGVVRHRHATFTVADVPGLIEGASDGLGLGAQFLRHVERCGALVYMLAADDEQPPAEQWRILRGELANHAADLLERPAVVVLSKADVLGPQLAELLAATRAAVGPDVHPLSSVSGEGVPALLDLLLPHVPGSTPAPQLDTWDPRD